MDSNFPRSILLKGLAIALFVVFSADGLATPKAAEDEDAQVTMGANVTPPKRSAKPAKQPIAGKKRSGAKAKAVKSHKQPKVSANQKVRGKRK